MAEDALNTTSTTEKAFRREDEEQNEEIYRLVTIGIIVCGLVMLVGLMVYVYKDDRRVRNALKRRKDKVDGELEGDIPPTYSKIVMRSEPPPYDESVMQEVNPEGNKGFWTQPEAEVRPEVRNVIAKKVESAAHGMLYQEKMRRVQEPHHHHELAQMRRVVEEEQRQRPTFSLGEPNEDDDGS